MIFTSFYFPQLFVIKSVRPLTQRPIEKSISLVKGAELSDYPQPFDFKSDALPTELAGLGECCPFKWPYYIHVLPIAMFTLLYVPE